MGRESIRAGSLWRVSWVIPIFVLIAGAQSFSSPQLSGQGSPRVRNPYGTSASAEADPVYDQRRMKALNADRHRSMVSDTEKLLQLAKQLDSEIAGNSTDGLTSQEMKQVAEIEKLARSVKEKMARSFGGGPLDQYQGFPPGISGGP
jgi:hypothetical protein